MTDTTYPPSKEMVENAHIDASGYEELSLIHI